MSSGRAGSEKSVRADLYCAYTTDGEHSGRPIETTTEEMINKIHHNLLDDCNVKALEA